MTLSHISLCVLASLRDYLEKFYQTLIFNVISQQFVKSQIRITWSFSRPLQLLIVPEIHLFAALIMEYRLVVLAQRFGKIVRAVIAGHEKQV